MEVAFCGTLIERLEPRVGVRHAYGRSAIEITFIQTKVSPPVTVVAALHSKLSVGELFLKGAQNALAGEQVRRRSGCGEARGLHGLRPGEISGRET